MILKDHQHKRAELRTQTLLDPIDGTSTPTSGCHDGYIAAMRKYSYGLSPSAGICRAETCLGVCVSDAGDAPWLKVSNPLSPGTAAYCLMHDVDAGTTLLE